MGNLATPEKSPNGYGPFLRGAHCVPPRVRESLMLRRVRRMLLRHAVSVETVVGFRSFRTRGVGQ